MKYIITVLVAIALCLSGCEEGEKLPEEGNGDEEHHGEQTPPGEEGGPGGEAGLSATLPDIIIAQVKYESRRPEVMETNAPNSLGTHSRTEMLQARFKGYLKRSPNELVINYQLAKGIVTWYADVDEFEEKQNKDNAGWSKSEVKGTGEGAQIIDSSNQKGGANFSIYEEGGDIWYGLGVGISDLGEGVGELWYYPTLYKYEALDPETGKKSSAEKEMTGLVKPGSLFSRGGGIRRHYDPRLATLSGHNEEKYPTKCASDVLFKTKEDLTTRTCKAGGEAVIYWTIVLIRGEGETQPAAEGEDFDITLTENEDGEVESACRTENGERTCWDVEVPGGEV